MDLVLADDEQEGIIVQLPSLLLDNVSRGGTWDHEEVIRVRVLSNFLTFLQ